MALYAFDGTGKVDDELDLTDSNVVNFTDAYKGNKYYQTGIGTRLGWFGRVFGSITGAGGRTRVRESLAALKKHMKDGDNIIDVAGFSRGAALAIHFANQVCKLSGSPRVRFLGLFDCVPSFGIPGNPIDIHWNLDCPENIDHCFHALALDERRRNFPLHRISRKQQDRTDDLIVVDVWFRGVHSDVGGGNRNVGLSSIALNWMFQNAIRCGLEFDMDKVRRHAAKMQPDSPISIHGFDPVKQPFRRLAATDLIHYSVAFRPNGDGREHNNPPAALAVVDDMGRRTGLFGSTGVSA